MARSGESTGYRFQRHLSPKSGRACRSRLALDYLSGNKTLLAEVTDPLALVGKQKEFDVTVLVKGGGLSGQVDAIKMAIAKAITVGAPDLRGTLKKAEFLRRDPREKERKKYGLRSARKREQYSKR